MTTKVKSDKGWKITCFDGSYVVYFNNFSVFENHPTLEKAVLSESLKGELKFRLSNEIELEINTDGHLLTVIGHTVVKDDLWRISKGRRFGDTVYIVQTRTKDTIPWNSPKVNTIAAFDNIEAAMLKVIEILESRNVIR